MSLQESHQSGIASGLRRSIVTSLIVPLALGPIASSAHPATADNTQSPIKHVIVIIGENRTFDHIFATYQPVGHQTVDNLLSKGIVNADGTPGPNFPAAAQYSAIDAAPSPYLLSPGGKVAYTETTLPPPVVAGPSVAPGWGIAAQVSALAGITLPCDSAPVLAVMAGIENGLPGDYLPGLCLGGTGLPAYAVVDTRIANVSALPPGPYPLKLAGTAPGAVSWDAYANSPVHRFYQMWQQMDCNAAYATAQNPSGCKADLFPWVETSIGFGTDGQTQAQYMVANYDTPPFGPISTGEGATAMGFYNVQQGDAPYFKSLADRYAMSDNYHQGVMGGTGANHIMIGMGDALWFYDGSSFVPPGNITTPVGSGVINEIENPNPAPGTNNWYTEDGYGSGKGTASAPYFGGGSYSNCSDETQPGVAEVRHYLRSLPHPVTSNCEAGHYYLLNNYNPGYYGDGSVAYGDTLPGSTVFTIPPSQVRHIGDALGEKGISYAYFGDQWNVYLANPRQLYVNPVSDYCNICNFFQYTSSIMGDPSARLAHLKDTTDLYAAIASNSLPAVSFVKPSGIVDGHPATSKLSLFEGFVKKIVDAAHANPEVWKDTAIFVTFDEGGGYYDSGYVQPVDFFGDGTRVPFLVVSPFVKPGHISHDYTDHASILKFIERNWNVAPITHRSRDNLPNPEYGPHSRYAPVNGPAIGDLFDLFSFSE